MEIEQVYVIIEETNCDEMIKCRVFFFFFDANYCIEEWADERGISLDPEETDADILIENNEEENFDYISSIIHDDYGKIRLIITELE